MTARHINQVEEHQPAVHGSKEGKIDKKESILFRGFMRGLGYE
jgi:hypothetical protein